MDLIYPFDPDTIDILTHLMPHLQPKLFIALLVGFVGFTVIGTLLHEMGHWWMATQCGFKASIHYNHASLEDLSPAFKQNDDTIQALRNQYHLVHKQADQYVLVDSIDFPQKQRYQALLRQQQRLLFPVHLGGPAQTMATGTIGVALLLMNRHWWRGKPSLKSWVWGIIFGALFWLRQLFNLTIATYSVLVGSQWSTRMDETKLALDLQLWPATISVVSGLVGLGVLVFITLRVIPSSQRLTFIGSGLVGGTLGFCLWLVWLGPQLMP